MRLANRTGRVIALARLLLALFFLLASTRSIDGPIAFPRLTLAISAGYLLFAALLLALTWRNWWLDYRLGLPAHLGDMATFLALDLAAGVPVTSPFFVFFVFLVLSAAARWGWRAGMWTAVATTLLFVGETALEIFTDSLSNDEYLYAFVRGGHLIVLSLMMSWFGATHLSGSFVRSCRFSGIRPGEEPVLKALTYAATSLGGRWSAMVWTEPEEPWVNIAYWDVHQGLSTARVGPEEFAWQVAPELQGHTFLFDLAKGRALSRHERRFRAFSNMAPVNPDLARRAGFEGGVATPIESRPFTGYLFIGDINGLAWEDTATARRCAGDLARGFERWDASRLIAETSESEARLRVARNLHDSVAQILAGLGLKLRAARTTAADEAQRDRELREIEDDLVLHQKHIYGFIEELRQPRGDGGRVDLEAELNDIAVGLRRQWAVQVDVTGDHLVAIPRLLGDEAAYLLREGAANAVRHGGATRLFLSGEVADDCLRLVIQDNGRGFPEAGSFDHFTLSQKDYAPCALLERVQSVGGTLDLVSSPEGAIITIIVPLGTAS